MPTKDNKVLLVKNPKVEYLSLVGGRVKFGENSLQSICREIEEELGIKISEKRLTLKYICENFYSFNQMRTYEILFVYTFEFSERKDFEERCVCDKTDCITFWLDIDKLKNENIKPNFIKNFTENKPFEFITQIDK